MRKFISRDPLNPVSLLTGEFVDKNREIAFFEAELKHQLTTVRYVMLVLSLLFTGFLLTDFLANQSTGVRITLVVLRLSVFLITLGVFFLLRNVNRRRDYVFLITASKAVVTIAFIIALAIYEKPNYLFQTMSAIVILVSFFLIFNRLQAVLGVSLLMIAGFLVVTEIQHGGVDYVDRLAAIIYSLMTLGLSALSYLRTSRLKRREVVMLEQLESLSFTDALTRCYNRMKMNDELRIEIERSRRYKVPMSLVLYDYDNFKSINDEFGHPAGDLVLIRTSRIVRSSIRTVDILARWGGEEFLLLLPDTGLKPAADLADRLREKISTCECGPVKKTTCSFGVTELKDGDTIETLLQRVDDLLYQAKTSGRNQVAAG